jgi:hypothetical protein
MERVVLRGYIFKSDATAALAEQLVSRQGFGVWLPEPYWVPIDDRRGVFVFDAAARRKDCDAFWGSLRAAYPETGLWPFVSSMTPLELAEHGRDITENGGGCHSAGAVPPVDMFAERIRTLSLHAGIEDVDAGDATVDDLVETIRERAERVLGSPGRSLSGEGPQWRYLMASDDAGLSIMETLRMPCAVNWIGDATGRGLEPADHVRIVRSWRDRFGAEVFSLDDKGMELLVPRPPTTWREVASVGLEQLAYSNGYDLDEFLGQVPAGSWSFYWT